MQSMGLQRVGHDLATEQQHHPGNSAQYYVVAWMGGEFGGEWKHVYLWLGPFAVPLKL